MIIQKSSDIKTDYFRDKNGEISPVDVLYEKHIINPDGLIQLQRIPSIDTVFTITTKSGINTITYNKANKIVNQNDFTVDYENGILTFHMSKINSPIQVSYTNAIGQMLISADRIFTRVDSTGKATEKLSEILDDSRVALDGIKTMGDASNIIMQTQSNINLIKNLTNDIVVAGNLNKELNINSGIGKGMNDTLIKTIDGATSKLAELDQWVTEHQDITNINSRLEHIAKKINSVEINVKYPPMPLSPCKMNGVDGDEINLQAILDYATSNYEYCNIIIPSGIMLIKNTIKINVARISIRCLGEIVCKMDKEKYAFEFGSNTNEGLYKKGRTVYEGLVLRCSDEEDINNRCNGIFFTGSESSIGASNINFRNCVVSNFNAGLTYGDRSYLIRMNNCDLYGNMTQIKVIGGFDTGENIKFVDCVIANGKEALYCDNEHSTIFFNGCSIDYNYSHIFNIIKGRVFAESCHFETTNNPNILDGLVAPFTLHQSDGNMLSISKSFIMFSNVGETRMKYIFDNLYDDNAYSCINVNNCFLQGLKTTSGYIGNGFINMHSNQTFQWDSMSYKLSEVKNKVRDGNFLDADLNNHSDFMKMQGKENTELFSKYELQPNTHYFGIRKSSGDKTHSSAGFVVPSNMLCTLLGAELTVASNKNTTIDITFGKCNYVNGEAINKSLMYNVGNIQVGLNPEIKKVLDRQLANLDSSRDYLFLEIGLFNCDANTEIYLKNVNIHEF